MTSKFISILFISLISMSFRYTGDEGKEPIKVKTDGPLCYREISPRLSGYLVELSILSNKKVTNVARIYEKVPKGYKAKAHKLNGAQLLPNDEKLRLIWYGLPAQDTVKISYFLIPESENEKTPKLKGKFQYLDGNFKKSEVDIYDKSEL